MYFEQNHNFEPGDIVYVLYRNPHAQNVAQVQEAAVVENPNQPGEFNLFMYDTYYPLDDEIAVFPTEVEAMRAYNYHFGEDGNLYG
ncbi:transcriptional regulator of the spore photoproduct lyase operon [Alkalibacillus filiformis]|uniref:Transcriptional regulator of the spore photoproduct lyase operon n=1 Tax=Alkalibacillus filiformis TaxID=200990 RepID=A0ABU0DS90_9BACI|nr:transcriptional regulator SplA domain-containing protein [Alkalibacillus filiformis]MDQ0351230.1 transcriptional regulator of the spore photoproduct lyase operon [Alkalibacillus filiformis]